MENYQPIYSAIQRSAAPQKTAYEAPRASGKELSMSDLIAHLDEVIRKADEPRCPWQMLNAVERLKKDL